MSSAGKLNYQIIKLLEKKLRNSPRQGGAEIEKLEIKIKQTLIHIYSFLIRVN